MAVIYVLSEIVVIILNNKIMFNLKKNLFLEGKMQSLCSGKYLRTLVF